MVEESRPDSTPPGVTPLQVCAMCADDAPVAADQAAAQAAVRYAPSPQQTAFFTLVWAAKRGARVDLPDAWLADEDGALLTEPEIRQQISRIRQSLAAFGPAVGELQRRDERAWELLRVQMEKPLRGYDCRLADKQDALSGAQLKVWQLLRRLPSPATLAAHADAVAAICSLPVPVSRIFDFTTPIYAYAMRMARNELLSLLRRRQAPPDADPEAASGPDGDTRPRPERGYTPDWERLAALATDDAGDNLAGDVTGAAGEDAGGDAGGDVNEAAYLAAAAALRTQLQRLLNAIHDFPQQQRRVLYWTLAARPQFFRALAVLELPLPPAIVALAPAPPAQPASPPAAGAGEQTAASLAAAALLAALPDDEAIARCMGSNKNLVAVTRHNALVRMAREDVELHALLLRLIEARRAKEDTTPAAALNVGASRA